MSFTVPAMLFTQTLCFASVSFFDPVDQTQPEQEKQNRPLYPSVEESHKNFNFFFDFLYWKADEDGLEYGTKFIATPVIGQSSKTKTKLLDLDFQWDPGFCIGAAYAFKELDDWTLQLNWTHIHNHAHGTSSTKGIESQVGNVNTIISPWVNLLFELRFGASHASAHWHLHYDTLDLGLCKQVSLSKRFLLTPFFGFRAAWIDQDYKAKYKSVFVLAEDATPFSRNVTFKGKNDFSAFGIRTGGEIVCKLRKNWYLFSQFFGNLVYGKFKILMKNLNDQGLGEGDIPPMPLDFKATENFWRVRLAFEEAIGLGWERFFQHNLSHLRIHIAYELSQWLNQNELFYTFYFRGQDSISSVPIRNQGNLSFQGIRVGMQYDF
ncbi:MAG TPA: Lpg1974 family pore-forming outer membrane protein [Rhabdochlamydiaceae bacterium]|jgi:hypothetical protein